MNIYVGNLPLDISIAELQQEFTVFGEVLSAVIMDNRYIGSSQICGYGYVEMASRSQGLAAIQGLKGKRLKDQVISVVEALPLSPRHSSASAKRSNNWASRKPRDRN